MALRKIRTGNDPVLRKICKPVNEITKSTLDLLDEDDDVQDVYHNWNE